MAARPVRLKNGRNWRTQAAAKKHFRDILHSYRPGDQIGCASHIDDLKALVDAYDEGWDGPKKGEKPISHFKVDHNRAEGRTTPSFYICYKDGTEDDLSLYRAVEWISQ